MPCCIISNYAIWQLSNMAAIKSKQTYINIYTQTYIISQYTTSPFHWRIDHLC